MTVYIRRLERSELPAAGDVIRAAFGTVAEAFGLTEENCPTNGAFLRDGALFEEAAAGTIFYGAFEGGELAGVAALKRKDGALFYLESWPCCLTPADAALAGLWSSTARRRRGGPEGSGFPSGSCMKTAPSCAGTSRRPSCGSGRGPFPICLSWSVLWNVI